MRALSLAGMDGEVLGNHEFDHGATNLVRARSTSWSQLPASSPRTTSSTIRPTRRSRTLRDVVAAVRDLRRRRPQGRRHRHGQPGTLHGIYRGRQLARLPPDRRQRRRSTQYVAPAAPGVDVVVVVTHLGLDEDEGLTAVAGRRSRTRRCRSRASTSILGGHLHIVHNPPKDAAARRRPSTASSRCQTVLVPLGRVREVRRPARPRRPRRRRTTPIPRSAAASSSFTYKQHPGRRRRSPTIPTSRTCCGRTRSSSTRTSTSTACSRTSTRRRHGAQDRRATIRPAATRSSATWSRARCSCSRASRPTSRSPTRSASAPTSSAARSPSSRCTTCSRSRTRSP